MNSSIFQMTKHQHSQEIPNDLSEVDKINNEAMDYSNSIEQFSNVFDENNGFGSMVPFQPVTDSVGLSKCVLPIELQPNTKTVTEAQKGNGIIDSNPILKPVAVPAESKGTFSDTLDSPSEKVASILKKQSIKPWLMPVKSEDQGAKRLDNPHGEALEETRKEIFLKGLNLWKIGKNPYSPEETELLLKMASLVSSVNHLSLPEKEILVLTSNDFSSVISVIKKLGKKVGLAELGVMVLITIAVDDNIQLRKSGYRSELSFFEENAPLMGISASCARDFAVRGRIFLRFRLDILNGIDEIPGIPFETFANTCLSKLTFFEKAVDAFGNKQALIFLQELTFKEFKKKVLSEVSKGHSFKKKKRLKESGQSDFDYNSCLQELELTPGERRLLRIRVKKGIPVGICQNLTDYQVSLIETRYREYRVKSMQDYYDGFSRRWLHYKPMDPENPLQVDDLCFHNGTVWEKIVATRDDYKEKPLHLSDNRPFEYFENRVFDFTDIVLRIRKGLSQIQPARRAIAVLIFRLVNEKSLKNKWKNPRDGVKYGSFRDFAILELGLGENYRDYLAVGKVLREYAYFLDYLSDVDTDDTFLKLRHLPDALKTHDGDEYLVLARLRSLSVREFMKFSKDPDFEINFGRRLSKKELKDFTDCCSITTKNLHGASYVQAADYIEAYL
jgi:hypothetical protein